MIPEQPDRIAAHVRLARLYDDKFDKAFGSTLNDLDDPLGSTPTRFQRRTTLELLAEDLTIRWDVCGIVVRPPYGVVTGELKSLTSTFGMDASSASPPVSPSSGDGTLQQVRRNFRISDNVHTEVSRPICRRFVIAIITASTKAAGPSPSTIAAT